MDPASAARAAGLPPGTQLGRYTLLRRFAVGGMAELYLAHQRGAEGFAKLVALKRILPHLASDPQLTRMFLDEARLAATLHHPNIAAVLDFGEYDGEHFLTMEYVHGRHLLDVLRAHAGRPLALPVALGIVSDVARALHHVHEQRGHDGRALGLVHRDVSPSNVLLSYEGAVKLADFGIAKAMELTSATRTGTFKGKLGYAAPEQCRGEPVNRRADVFALGILLYETTTGARAFSGPNEFAVLGRVARGDYVPPLELDPDYPAWLAPVIARTLALDPEQRPATAAALADELDELAYATFERSSPTRVATMMHGSFGDTPPVTSVAELSLVGAPVLRTGTMARRRPGALRWLGAVGMASLLVGAWAWGRAAAQAEARAPLASAPEPPIPVPTPEPPPPAPSPAAPSPTELAPTPAASSPPAIIEPTTATPTPTDAAKRPRAARARKPVTKSKPAAPAAGLEDLLSSRAPEMMLALVLVLALAPARDPDVVAGEAAYREHRWDDASVAFDAAWRRSGDPIFLYTRAQVERLAGRCEIAVGLYEQFLATSPPSQAGAAAQQYLEQCRGQLPPPRPLASETSAPVTATTPETLPPAQPAGRRAGQPWSRDPAAAVLVATGGAAMVIGGVLLGLAYRDVEQAGDQPDDRAYGEQVARARRFAIAGATLLPVGAALAIGGAIRWAVLARRSRTPRVALGVLGSTTSARGFGLSLRGTFGVPLARR